MIRPRRPRRHAAGAILVALLCVVTGCGTATTAGAPATSSPVTTGPTTEPTTSASETPRSQPACATPAAGFDCDFQQRFAAVAAYLKGRPGVAGVVVRDRRTGAVWRTGATDTAMWTESTIKLAMTVDLFLRDRAGKISLTSADRGLIQKMLHSSDDAAADALWSKYSGADHKAFNRDFGEYGMTSLVPQRGYTSTFPYWGFQKCTPDDLDRLVNYVLDKLPADTRQYIVDQLSDVDADQQWGVWAAGPAANPGNKDGWGPEDDGWVMNTVGWAGPGQRYTLTVMNELRGHGGEEDGRATDSHVAELLFAGRFP
ncbi:tat pathway signal sequence [Amycolatopsis sp.]|uniref:tat pathway signal sequence n=1 Tax=Amycolatopsis sp. TaxID=37632 RepID=UPI002C6056F1|nr:tat pathway signal sequence [Amycolatopsis sp.]HVV12531.1 tat pathway signal sequence [Amycolatopsis sp.]